MSVLTFTEAMKQFGVARSTFYKYVDEGRVTVVPTPNRPKSKRGVDVSEMVRVFGEPSSSSHREDQHCDNAMDPSENDQKGLDMCPERSKERTVSMDGSLVDALVSSLQSQIDTLKTELKESRGMQNELLSLLKAKLLPVPTDSTTHNADDSVTVPIDDPIVTTPTPAQEPHADHRPPAIKKGSREWKKLKKRRKKLRDKDPNSPDLIEIEQIFKNIKKTNPKR